MGLLSVPVTLRKSQRSRRKYHAPFLVDTGATDTMAPASELTRAGIRKRGRGAYELADGSMVEFDFGLVEIEVMGKVTSGRVLFGSDDCEPLLGVTALESLGFVVDPRGRRLLELPAIPLKRVVRP